VAFVCLLCAPSPAQAYIDPGTGSLAYQVLLAAALGAMFFVRQLRTRVAAIVRKLAGRSSAEPPQKPV
jgi:hypothetical protein